MENPLKTNEENPSRTEAESAPDATRVELRACTARLAEANRELEGFTYSVSHDLRAPIRIIDGFTQMILTEKGAEFDAETLRKFQVVRDNVHKMNRLLDALVGLSRLGRCSMNQGTLDLNDIARDAVKALRTTAADRDLSIEIGHLPIAEGDPALVRQLFDILLSNAAKFTREAPEARIEMGSIETPRGSVCYIRDNGIGFDMKYYDRLFGVFQRLVSESRFEGLGAGLAAARRIVQRHGGALWAEGLPEGGATFYFSLVAGATPQPKGHGL